MADKKYVYPRVFIVITQDEKGKFHFQMTDRNRDVDAALDKCKAPRGNVVLACEFNPENKTSTLAQYVLSGIVEVCEELNAEDLARLFQN